MSDAVVVALIELAGTVIPALITAAVALRVSKGNQSDIAVVPTLKNKRRITVTLSVVLVAVLGFFVAQFFASRVIHPCCPCLKLTPTADITSPKPFESIPAFDTVTGTYQNVCDDQDIWIYVYSRTTQKYYLHLATKAGTSTWEVKNVRFGGDGDPAGTEFTVGVVVADNNMNAELVASGADGEATSLQATEFLKHPKYPAVSIVVSLSSTLVPVVAITSPKAFEKIPISGTVTGTYQNVREGQNIWIYVYIKGLNRYYPHQANKVDGSNWEVKNVLFGGKGDPAGTEFTVGVVVADNNMNVELGTSGADGEATSSQAIEFLKHPAK